MPALGKNSHEKTFCQILKKEDGKINWTDTAEDIFNRFRAFYPWPGIFTFWNGQRIKLNKITLEKSKSNPQTFGKIFTINESIAVQAKDGIIILEEIQLEGRGFVTAKDFANGHQEFIGSIFE